MTYEEDLKELNDTHIEMAQKYALYRTRYGKAKSELDVILASKISGLIAQKKNIGYEMGLIMISDTGPLKGLYKEMVEAQNNYKGLERILTAVESKIMSIMGIMKYNAKND